MLGFFLLNLTLTWRAGLPLRCAWRLEPSWTPFWPQDAQLARQARLTFRQQPSYNRCRTAKLRHVAEEERSRR